MLSLSQVLSIIAGIGLFLYGMDLMGAGLKQLAGASLEKILEKLTNNKLKGLGLGTAVTALIQSSAATCIMCLGFINAGIMTLGQSIPVVFGANIGSTITGQILRLGDIGSGSIILTMMKPSSFSSLLIAYGVIVLVFVKTRKKRMNALAQVLLGLGILFFGMFTMETNISPLKDVPEFRNLFTMFDNPFMGVLFGALVTAIIQSSSASVGILQALTATGAITWNIAIPIILGQNIGKCITVFLGSLKASKDSKRLSLVHFMFNILGAVIIGVFVFALNAAVHLPFWNSTVTRGNIADFHTLFNVITALLLLPFSNLLAKLAIKIIPEKEQAVQHHRVDQLDDLLLKTPIVALDTARKVTIQMGKAALENFRIVSDMVLNFSEEKLDLMDENENFLDQAESKVSDYLVKIDPAGTFANLEANEILRTVNDFERIGDYCVNIYDMVVFNRENNIEFTPTCLSEIESMNKAVCSILELTVQAFEKRDTQIAAKVEPLEEVIDSMKELISSRHIERLRNNLCTVQGGISLVEYLNSVERISDHCSNVAIHAIRSRSSKADFDTHSYLSYQHEGVTEDYKVMYRYYETEFFDKIAALPTVAEEKKAQKAKESAKLLREAQLKDLADRMEELKAEDQKEKDAENSDKKKSKDKEKNKDKEKDKDKKKDKK